MNKNRTFLDFIAENNLIHVVFSIIIGFLVGTIFLVLLDISVSEAYGALIYGAFRSVKSFSYCLVYAAPYIMTGLSVAFAYKTGIFNIGAEGEFVIGSITACVLGILLGDLPKIILVPLCMLSAMIAGALFGLIVGLLKIYFNVNEVLSMIMGNWIVYYLSNYIVGLSGIKTLSNAETTKNISDNARILFSKDFINTFSLCNKANWGIILALIFTIIIWFVINKTTIGFKLRSVGYSSTTAEYAGIDVKKSILLTLAIAGALSGMGGAIQLMGMGKRVAVFSGQEGFGFSGIVVALIGMCDPIGVFLSGIFFGTLRCAGRNLNLIGAPTQVIDIIVGTIVFFISISAIFSYIKYLKINKKEGSLNG